MSELQQYPKCKYRRADAPPGYEVVAVNDPDEEKALGKGWEDAPPGDDPSPAPKKKS